MRKNENGHCAMWYSKKVQSFAQSKHFDGKWIPKHVVTTDISFYCFLNIRHVFMTFLILELISFDIIKAYTRIPNPVKTDINDISPTTTLFPILLYPQSAHWSHYFALLLHLKSNKEDQKEVTSCNERALSSGTNVASFDIFKKSNTVKHQCKLRLYHQFSSS